VEIYIIIGIISWIPLTIFIYLNEDTDYGLFVAFSAFLALIWPLSISGIIVMVISRKIVKIICDKRYQKRRKNERRM